MGNTHPVQYTITAYVNANVILKVFFEILAKQSELLYRYRFKELHSDTTNSDDVLVKIEANGNNE